MKKILRNSIFAIVIGVAVVLVPIAVASWMGALTFTFMKTEELKFQGRTWATGRTSISITVKNTGSGEMSISAWRIDDVVVPAVNVTYTSGSAVLKAGDTAVVQIKPTSGNTFTSGVDYEFTALSAAGNKYTYVVTCP